MKPIYITINETLHLKIIPDSQFHLDGHPVLTHNYNVYLNDKADDVSKILGSPDTDKLTNPDYYGAIAFEKPGHIYSYTPAEYHQLTRAELEAIIELLNHHRDNPANWHLEN